MPRKNCSDSSSDKEYWIGSDFSWRWWHYWCGGLEECQMPHYIGENMEVLHRATGSNL